MEVICISASNVISSSKNSVSYRTCEMVQEKVNNLGRSCEIIDLRAYSLSPCIGCGKCYESRRCVLDQQFNQIYEKVSQAKCVFIVAPHYAPIPAKLCMLLEKMEQITFLHWWKDSTYQSELNGIPTGIISHGGGADWALVSYKAMVNDTIANALDTIQCRVIPYNNEWNTGISLPVLNVVQEESIFPIQEYEWNRWKNQISEYVEIVVNRARQ